MSHWIEQKPYTYRSKSWRRAEVLFEGLAIFEMNLVDASEFVRLLNVAYRLWVRHDLR